MTMMDVNSVRVSSKGFVQRPGERGAALATAILMLALLSAVAMTVLAVVHTETRIAGGDLRRTQTFYAAAAGIEKMTSDYSALFGRTSRPTQAQFDSIAGAFPTELIAEGFQFNNPAIGACNCSQSIISDTNALFDMRTTQGIDTASSTLPRVTMPPNSTFGGLIASVDPYELKSTATFVDGTQVQLTRNMNNYLIPLFQFGMFSDEDIELHPGPPFTFNGRVHANGNIYANGIVTFLDKVTTANEFIYDVLRNGGPRATGSNVSMVVGATNVALTQGSMTDGPNITGATAGQRGFFPLSFNGTPNSSWDTTSVQTADGSANKFGGKLLTRTTGGSPLRLPMQLDGAPTREIIKRRMPNDNLPAPAAASALSESRYHSKAGIRILIDDEGVTTDASGLYAAQNGDVAGNTHDGVNLSTFIPVPLPAGATSTAATGGGRALFRFNDDGTLATTLADAVLQETAGTSTHYANTVRSVQSGPILSDNRPAPNAGTGTIPGGAGLTGHILIQLVDSDGVWRDVTSEILSMGMTEGEPNSIVQLQRPLWGAFTQGSRDARGNAKDLASIINNTNFAADGEIGTSPGLAPTQDSTYGFLNGIVDDTDHVSGTQPRRRDTAPSNLLATLLADWGTANWDTNRDWDAIVPINLYNVREGRISTSGASDSATANAVYERGITNIVEINMKNLARWVDGFYDANLLFGTPAVSANINRPDGYVVYVSDRRGDNVKSMVDLSGATIDSTNGMVDNVDVYGPNDQMDAGEDVQGSGAVVGSALVKDTAELQDPVVLSGTTGADLTARTKRAIAVAAWPNPTNYFRRSVRLFNGEDLQATQVLLSTTLGITIATENMAYTWGNYNTTGINEAPPAGTSSLNDSTQPSYYLPIAPSDRQVPASIVCDAFSPLSKTWFDSSSAMYPENFTSRVADLLLPAVTDETSVRAGIIAGNNLGALANDPDAGNSGNGESRLNGGMHNFPRFLENWSGKRFNLVGSLIPLYRSTQALGPYNANSTIYSPPTRNWGFDVTFTNPARLPPGTPQFQHIEPTGFRQVL